MLGAALDHFDGDGPMGFAVLLGEARVDVSGVTLPANC